MQFAQQQQQLVKRHTQKKCESGSLDGAVSRSPTPAPKDRQTTKQGFCSIWKQEFPIVDDS